MLTTDGKVVFSTIECIGIMTRTSSRSATALQKELKEREYNFPSIFLRPCYHSCIDTQGLWKSPFFVKLAKNIGVTYGSKGEYSSGTDPKYMNFLFEKTTDTIVEACKSMKSGEM